MRCMCAKGGGIAFGGLGNAMPNNVSVLLSLDVFGCGNVPIALLDLGVIHK